MLVAGHSVAYPQFVKNLFSQTVFLCFSFKMITVDFFNLSFMLIFFFPGKLDLLGKSFSCSVLCTEQSMRVCCPAKLRRRLYIQKKIFLFDTGIFYIFFCSLEISSHLHSSMALCCSYEYIASVILCPCFLQLFT